jgi:hypothetical protein
MNENYEQPNDATFICDFGTVRLDIPFAQQPSLQQFLDVPTSAEERLLSDKFLQRFLSVAECVIKHELINAVPQQELIELHLGYELWKALPPDSEDHTIQPGDLVEFGWLKQAGILEEPPTHEHPSDVLPNQVVERFVDRCQEEARQRLGSNVPKDQSLNIFIYGTTRRFSSMFESLPRATFGERGCTCGDVIRRGDTCEKSCR